MASIGGVGIGTTTLYTHRMCPFAQKTWIALNLFQEEHLCQLEEIDLYGSKKPSFFVKPPFTGKVPALRHSGLVIVESEKILDHVCNEFTLPGGKSLYADDRELEAWWRTTINGDLLKYGKQSVLNGILHADMKRVLNACENRVDANSAFLIGSSVSLADVVAFPFLYRLDNEYLFAEIGYPNLKRWLENIRRVDAFEKTVIPSWWWWW